VLKEEVYQLSPAPVTTEPAPLRGVRVECFESVDEEGGMRGWAPWAPCVPPEVMVKLVVVAKVGGPVGAEDARPRKGRRRAI
jgi:hypothetical protein